MVALGPAGAPGPAGPAGATGPTGPAGANATIAANSVTGADIDEATLQGIVAGGPRVIRYVALGASEVAILPIDAGSDLKGSLAVTCIETAGDIGVKWLWTNSSGTTKYQDVMATLGSQTGTFTRDGGRIVAGGFDDWTTPVSATANLNRSFELRVAGRDGGVATIEAHAVTDASGANECHVAMVGQADAATLENIN